MMPTRMTSGETYRRLLGICGIAAMLALAAPLAYAKDGGGGGGGKGGSSGSGSGGGGSSGPGGGGGRF